MPQTHQLAAIMFTDIVGYTAMMQENEAQALDVINRFKEVLEKLAAAFEGRIVQYYGDGCLLFFSSATDAVNLAKRVQEEFCGVPQVPARIGIHMGDVLLKEGNVFGDAVNIASRLQALAPQGSIYISETVFQNIANKKEIQTKFVREERLKNVKEPVRIYEVVFENNQSPGGRTVSNDTLLKSSSQRSVAVLPFVNMSSDPEQEYFSDGLTEEIITDLSRLEKLLVISRSSMMTFKGTHKKTKEIADEVNARYILEGSVRKAGNNLRISAQLIDAHNDVHLWAEKYSGTVDDIFDIQEKVALSIVEALNVKLTRDEENRLSRHPIQNTQAYEWYIRAWQEMFKRNEQSLDNAITLAQRGLDLVGDNALLYSILGTAYLYFQHYGIRPNPVYLDKARQYASKSLELDADTPQAHIVLGVLAFKEDNLQKALNIFKGVLQLDQNNTEAMVWQIVMYMLAGRPDAARPVAEKLLRIDPLTLLSVATSGQIEFYSGNFALSLPYYRRWLKLAPKDSFTLFMCSWNFAMNNELKESIDLLDAMIKDTPNLIFGKFALFFKSALQGDKESALQYATNELKREAASLDYFPINMAWGYALIDEKDEAIKWLEKSLDFGISPYPLMLKFEIFHDVLKDHKGFQIYMQEIKKRSEEFVV